MDQSQRLFYLAGFFDGEGCISFSKVTKAYKTKGYYRLSIAVGQSTVAILKLFQVEFGGKIYLSATRGIPWSYSWMLTNRKETEKFLSVMCPLLVLKRPEAELAIQYLSTVKTRKECGGYWKDQLTDEIREQRDDIFDRIKLRKKANTLISDDTGQLFFRAKPKVSTAIYRD